MKMFAVKLFHRTTPDDGKLDAPENYALVGVFSIAAYDPKKAAENAAAQSDAIADGRRRTKSGDIAVTGGLAFEWRVMGWIEHRDPYFAGALGLPAHGIAGALARTMGAFKIQWERAKGEMRS